MEEVLHTDTTRHLLTESLKRLMVQKPLNKISIREITEGCGVNRQTFYYHFDDVYDLLEWVFEEDANRVLPSEIYYEKWKENVSVFFRYLEDNRTFVLNIFNSQNRAYLLRYLKRRLHLVYHAFAAIVAEGQNVEWGDFEFICDFYVNGIVGIIAQWCDIGMPEIDENTKVRFYKILDNSTENLLARFKKD